MAEQQFNPAKVSYQKLEISEQKLKNLRSIREFPQVDQKEFWIEDEQKKNSEEGIYITDNQTIIKVPNCRKYFESRDSIPRLEDVPVMTRNGDWIEKTWDRVLTGSGSFFPTVSPVGWFNLATYGETFSEKERNKILVLQAEDGRFYFCSASRFDHIITIFFANHDSLEDIIIRVGKQGEIFIFCFYHPDEADQPQPFAMISSGLHNTEVLKVIKKALKEDPEPAKDDFDTLVTLSTNLFSTVSDIQTELQGAVNDMKNNISDEVGSYKDVADQYKEFVKKIGMIKADAFDDVRGTLRKLNKLVLGTDRPSTHGARLLDLGDEDDIV